MDNEAAASGRRLSVDVKDRDGQSLRQWVYNVLEEGQTDEGVGRFVEFGSHPAHHDQRLAVILETVPTIYGPNRAFFSGFETFTVYAFAIEYLIRLWASVEDPRIGLDKPLTGRLRFAMRPMSLIDLLSFLPYFVTLVTGGAVDLRALRILRLLRLLKIARYSQAHARHARRPLRRAPSLAGLVHPAALHRVHRRRDHASGRGCRCSPKLFGDLPSSMYWAITTLSTVGYGDETPVTMLGKLIAGVTMVVGLVLFAMPIGIISVGFVNGLHRREFSISWSMVKRQPLFEGFDVEAVSRIVDLMGATVVQDHTRVATAGQPAEKFYLIISGRARAEDDTGSWDLEAGDMIGEEALVDGSTNTKSVTARTEMRLMVLPSEDLRRLCRKYPLLQQRIRNEVAW